MNNAIAIILFLRGPKQERQAGCTARMSVNDPQSNNVFGINCVTKSAEGLEQIGKNHVGNEYDPRDVLKSIQANYKVMGFAKKTIYLEGGGSKVVYEKKGREL